LHTAAAVAADFHAYGELAAVGGALALHDAAPQIYSVLRVVVEQVLPDHRFRPKCLVDGLLVLERVG
jgi:hypothetical protein